MTATSWHSLLVVAISKTDEQAGRTSQNRYEKGVARNGLGVPSEGFSFWRGVRERAGVAGVSRAATGWRSCGTEAPPCMAGRRSLRAQRAQVITKAPRPQPQSCAW